ncbi:MAG TPA: ribosome silencing factor [Usitatibacter sp.]|jgi:ribosome-associated protein|nr:ribosome silencing factor [Usitatibacter sp.]
MKKLSTLAKKKLVISALEDIKAHDIQAIDVRKLTPIFDWVVVATADSARQTKALSRHVLDTLKGAGSSIVGTEGEDSGDWILVDAGDIVTHVMQPAVRAYYALEELWSDGKFDDVVNSTAPVEATRVRSPRKRTAEHEAAPAKKPRKRKAAAGAPRAKAGTAREKGRRRPAA